jgi:hypothetical protein
VLARDGVLGLECVRKRREGLAVEPLRAILVLEGSEQAADLCRRELRNVPLQGGKGARP